MSRADGVRAFERAVLLYSPLWMAVVAWAMFSGTLFSWRDPEHLALGIGLALPLVLLPFVPAALGDERTLSLGARYATRAILYLSVCTFVQMWIGSILFFDRLGMEYHFHTTWALNRSPLFLYPMTLAYFGTYYVVMQVLVRWLPLGQGARRLLAIAAISYLVAFCETAAMATPVMRAFFFYRDKGFMLLYGSFCYGSVFFATLPGFLRCTEPRPLGKVLADALLGNAFALGLYAIYWFALPYLPRP